MNLRRQFRALNSSILLVTFLVLCFPLVPRLAAAPVRPLRPTSLALDLFQPVLSDFDNDNKIDRAVLRYNGGRKTIHVTTLDGSSWTALSFDSNTPDRGNLISGDIDHDGDADLVWISYGADQFMAWLGDGRGNFRASTDRNINLEQLLTPLWHSNRTPVIRGDGDSPTAIPTFLSWILRTAHREPVLVSRNLHSMSNAGLPRHFDVTVLKLRGPPSPISTS